MTQVAPLDIDKALEALLNTYVDNYNLGGLAFRQSGQQTLKRAIKAEFTRLLEGLAAKQRQLLDINTDSLVETDRGKEHPFVEAVPLEVINNLIKELK